MLCCHRSGCLAEALGQAGASDAAVERPTRQRLLEDPTRLDQLLEIDPGLQSHALQHEHEILGRDVPGRPRREWTAAEASERRVERADAEIGRAHVSTPVTDQSRMPSSA